MKENNKFWVTVVDDDEINRSLAKNILTGYGMKVTTLESGNELLSFVMSGNTPDVILLDVLMPEIGGFETLSALREWEKENSGSNIPVIFITADEDKKIEAKGFNLGATDFIRKPLEPSILIHRITNVVGLSRQIKSLSAEAQTDKLTGLLNKIIAEKEIEKECEISSGVLLVIDLDSFKLVNDIYGHEAGDKILEEFSKILRRRFRAHDILGRIGGDEFIAFLKNADSNDTIKAITRRLNEQIRIKAFQILGPDMSIPIGVSVGAAMTKGDIDYKTLFNYADKALLSVKQNGKHSCLVWSNDENTVNSELNADENLKKLKMILDERNVGNHALWLGQESFSSVYRYMLRYIKRYNENAYQVFFSVIPKNEEMKESEFLLVVERFGDVLKSTLRNSDIMMQSDNNHFLLLLPMVSSENIETVINRIIAEWDKNDVSSKVDIEIEKEAVLDELEPKNTEENKKAPWVIVVDDDVAVLKTAGRILSDDGIHVTALNSGNALMDLVEKNGYPDLVLVDILMPGLSGFDTVIKLKTQSEGKDVPVIFLTGASDEDYERRGLSLGAFDFIRKPFSPEVLKIRVRSSIEFANLKKIARK